VDRISERYAFSQSDPWDVKARYRSRTKSEQASTSKYLGGHPEKAANAITFLQDLINSGQLSGSDQMIAGYLISDLKNALGR